MPRRAARPARGTALHVRRAKPVRPPPALAEIAWQRLSAPALASPKIATLRRPTRSLTARAYEPPAVEKARNSLERIVRDADRASNVIGRIRALVKKAPPRNESFNIGEAIREVVGLTNSEALKNQIAVKTHLSEDLPLIQGDRVQLQQVLLNLIVNAIQAMAAGADGGRDLLVTVAPTEPNGVLVAVADSGPGLDPANLEHVFDPFFTTKPEGLGIGLSICRSIIDAHCGRLWVSANQPRGAVFQFTLPARAATGNTTTVYDASGRNVARVPTSAQYD